jgi:hypothetical protein
MRGGLRAQLLFVFLLTALAVRAQAPPLSAPVLPFAEVKAGLKGTGYSVFSGDTITPFDAEVLGTVQQGAAQPRAIVCKLGGAHLESTGVLAAMSGSPIFVDGKFLGAVAFTWPFVKEPICGVTPAEDMLAVEARGRLIEKEPQGVKPSSLSAFQESLARLSQPSCQTLSAPLNKKAGEDALANLSALGFEWRAASEAGWSASSGSAPIAEAPGPGGMIGVQLVSGDIQFTAFGTVSWVKDGNFLAFGHPLAGLGTTEMPVVGARVVAAVPSLLGSFKLSSATGPLGVVKEDRPMGVFGRFGPAARMLPVTLSFKGAGLEEKRFRFEVLRHRTLTPALVAGSLGTLYGTFEDPAAPKLLLLKGLTLKPSGKPPVLLEDQAFSGPMASAAMADFVSSALDLLAGNPHEAVPLEGVTMAIEVQPANRTTLVEAAWLDRQNVSSGEPLTLSVRLRPFQAPAEIVTCSIPTEAFPPGDVTLWVGGTFSILKNLDSAAEELPQDADGYLRYLGRIPSDEGVIVAAAAQDSAPVMMNHRIGSLPLSVQALMGTQPAVASAASSEKRLLWKTRIKAEGAVSGLVELMFTVKERAR